MKANEFDKKFDDNQKDIVNWLDNSTAQRINKKAKPHSNDTQSKPKKDSA